MSNETPPDGAGCVCCLIPRCRCVPQCPDPVEQVERLAGRQLVRPQRGQELVDFARFGRGRWRRWLRGRGLDLGPCARRSSRKPGRIGGCQRRTGAQGGDPGGGRAQYCRAGRSGGAQYHFAAARHRHLPGICSAAPPRHGPEKLTQRRAQALAAVV